MSSTVRSKGESGSSSPVLVSTCKSSDHWSPGPRGKGRGKGGLSVMVSASGRFSARGKEEKFCAVSPRPGRKRMAFVGWALGGRWMIGLREGGKSDEEGMG